MFSMSINLLGLLALAWWVWVLIFLVVVLLLVLLFWWLLQRGQTGDVQWTTGEKVAAESVAEASPPVESPTPLVPDDLTRIEGVGPKISSLLQAAGIATFAQLADADVSRLGQILTEAGLSALADPSTWAEQARLAAAGEWDVLETLQEDLKGGRRE